MTDKRSSEVIATGEKCVRKNCGHDHASHGLGICNECDCQVYVSVFERDAQACAGYTMVEQSLGDSFYEDRRPNEAPAGIKITSEMMAALSGEDWDEGYDSGYTVGVRQGRELAQREEQRRLSEQRTDKTTSGDQGPHPKLLLLRRARTFLAACQFDELNKPGMFDLVAEQLTNIFEEVQHGARRVDYPPLVREHLDGYVRAKEAQNWPETRRRAYDLADALASDYRSDSAKINAVEDASREIARLRNVIVTGGAAYRAERAALGVPSGQDPDSTQTVCAYCGEASGHTKRCSVTKFGAAEHRTETATSEENKR